MTICKAYDVAYVRFRVTNLEVMRSFLADFGMMETQSAETDKLYMRGSGTNPFVHVSELADEPGFAGFGLRLSSEQALEQLAAEAGVEVHPLGTPGGGRMVRLIDPDGFVVEAVAGVEPCAQLAFPPTKPWNQGGENARQSDFRRVVSGPSHVMRLGHVVLGVSDFARSEAWYKKHFGLLTSDAIQPAPGVTIGAFMRCDRGNEPCDHHTLFLLERPGATPGFMHAAFEVSDLDDLMAGYDHLVKAGYSHQWGVGRHILGSQVFDYWHDPYGNEIEHWTDGDQLVATDPGGIASVEDLMGVQWGMPMPPLPHEGAPGQ